MTQKANGLCDCNIKLPHTPDQVWQYSQRTVPSYHHPTDAEFEQEGAWAFETANFVTNLSATVHETCSETAKLKQRVGCLEDRVEQAEKTGAIQHSQECAFSKRFVGSAEPRPPKPPNADKATIKLLEEKLKTANTQLVQNRNQLLKLRDEVRLCKQLLGRELGLDEGVDNLSELLRSNTFLGWKGRAQIIRNLRARIADLEAKLQETQMLFRHDVEKDCYNPSFQADTDYAVSRNQRQVLNKLYSDKNQLLMNKDQEISKLQEDYHELEILYKATVSRNKTLSEELKDQKDKTKTLNERVKGDETLIEALMKHQNIMRDMLEQQKRASCRETLREQDLQEIMSTITMNAGGSSESSGRSEKVTKDIECEKYKTLLQMSENAAQNLENMVIELQKRLDLVRLQVVEAEKHCSDHQSQMQELRKQFEQMKKSGKVYIRSKTQEDKNLQRMIIDAQLKAIQEENQLLRNFVKDTVLAKADDFQLYKASLEAAKKSYLVSLKKIKESLQRKEGENFEEEEGEAD